MLLPAFAEALVDVEDEAEELLVEDGLTLDLADDAATLLEADDLTLADAEEILDCPALDRELRSGDDTGIFETEVVLEVEAVVGADALLWTELAVVDAADLL